MSTAKRGDNKAQKLGVVYNEEGQELQRVLAYRYVIKPSGALGLRKRFEWRVKHAANG